MDVHAFRVTEKSPHLSDNISNKPGHPPSSPEFYILEKVVLKRFPDGEGGVCPGFFRHAHYYCHVLKTCHTAERPAGQNTSGRTTTYGLVIDLVRPGQYWPGMQPVQTTARRSEVRS